MSSTFVYRTAGNTAKSLGRTVPPRSIVVDARGVDPMIAVDPSAFRSCALASQRESHSPRLWVFSLNRDARRSKGTSVLLVRTLPRIGGLVIVFVIVLVAFQFVTSQAPSSIATTSASEPGSRRRPDGPPSGLRTGGRAAQPARQIKDGLPPLKQTATRLTKTRAISRSCPSGPSHPCWRPPADATPLPSTQGQPRWEAKPSLRPA